MFPVFCVAMRGALTVSKVISMKWRWTEKVNNHCFKLSFFNLFVLVEQIVFQTLKRDMAVGDVQYV